MKGSMQGRRAYPPEVMNITRIPNAESGKIHDVAYGNNASRRGPGDLFIFTIIANKLENEPFEFLYWNIQINESL